MGLKPWERSEIDLRETTIVKRAYPKKDENFIFDIVPQILGFLKTWEKDKAKDLLDKSLHRPEIELDAEEMKENFLGKVVLTGNVIIKKWAKLLYNVYARGDELEELKTEEWEEKKMG